MQGHNYDTVLPELLGAGVRVMVYAGDQDLICNWVSARVVGCSGGGAGPAGLGPAGAGPGPERCAGLSIPSAASFFPELVPHALSHSPPPRTMQVGNRQWVDALPWAGAKRWAAAGEEAWEVGGAEAGTVTEAGGLSFVKVFEAGHMVPMDQPRNALAMITRWTRNQRLAAAPADAASGSRSGAKRAAGSQRLLPGSTWRLRRALPAGDAALTTSAEA